MASDINTSRVQPLARYCYRVILTNIDAFDSFGALPVELCEPVLWECSSATLYRLEENTPSLQSITQACWKNLCQKDYPIQAQQFLEVSDTDSDPDWRSRYLDLKEAQRRRFEELGTRIRGQRQEAEEKKRERATMFTEPIVKRAKTSYKSASLFDKTRKDSVKLQRSVYGGASLAHKNSSSPTKPKSRHPVSSISLRPPSSGLSKSPPSSSSLSAVSFTTPYYRSHKSSSPPLMASSSSCRLTSPKLKIGAPQAKLQAPMHGSNKVSTDTSQISTQLPTAAVESRATAIPSNSPAKKDPLAALFMPKHKAYSQRPLPRPVTSTGDYMRAGS